MSLSRMKATTWRCRCTAPVLVDVGLLGLGDALLDHRPQRLGLGLGGDDGLGGDQRGDQVAHHGLLVLGVTAEARALPGPAGQGGHGGQPSLVRSDRPRSSSFWSTSSRDFWPKLVMASRSSSVFWTSSPTVLTWARFRQLRGRSERSRSSIGRSRSGEPLVAGADVAQLEALRALAHVGDQADQRAQGVAGRRQRLPGRDGAVGGDVEDQPVEVGGLLDPGGLDA